MNPPHHDDYLNAQMQEYHSEGPAPAHHLPFDRLLPVPASFASAGELGEYMPQEDLASVTDVPSGDAPGSDPAADGDDEDVHVAHADDVEVQLAVSDERHMYVPHGDDMEVFLGDVHVIDVRGGVDSAVVVGDEDVDETVITAEHEIPVEAQAGGVEVAEPTALDEETQQEETQREEMLAQETEEEGTQEEERHEEEMRAETTDEAAPEEMAHEELVGDEMAPDATATGAVAHEETVHEAVAPEAVAPEAVAPEAVAPEAVAPEAMASDEVAHDEETHDIHAHDGQAHDAAADSHTDQAPMDEAHMDGEHMFEGEAHEEHAHSEPAGAEHQHAAAAQYEEADHHADAHVEHHMERHMEQHDEHHDDSAHEEEAETVHAGHAVAEEREVPVPVSAAHDDAHDEAEDSAHDDATGTDSHGGNGAPTTQQAISMAHAPAPASGDAPADTPVEHVSSAMEARGMLEGVAQSLRTLAGRDANGEGIVVFPRGVDVLEVRMHISRERDIDLNFRVAGPTLPSTSI
jgi:hypothetical protein